MATPRTKAIQTTARGFPVSSEHRILTAVRANWLSRRDKDAAKSRGFVGRLVSGKSLAWLWRWANLAVLPLVGVMAFEMAVHPWATDDLGYWLTRSGPLYDIAWNSAPQAYVYSPAFAQLIAPLTALPYETFHVLWTLLQVGVLLWLVGPVGALAALSFFWIGDVQVRAGNIGVLMAGALVFRLWPFLLLTKLTPGVVLAWYVVRREWKEAAAALGATAAIIAVSVTLWPSAWPEWAGTLVQATGAPLSGVPVPLWLRLPVALGVVVLAARAGQRWPLAIAAWLAMPDMGWSGATWLLAIPRLARRAVGEDLVVRRVSTYAFVMRM